MYDVTIAGTNSFLIIATVGDTDSFLDDDTFRSPDSLLHLDTFQFKWLIRVKWYYRHL